MEQRPPDYYTDYYSDYSGAIEQESSRARKYRCFAVRAPEIV
jgi:hypothetical protein